MTTNIASSTSTRRATPHEDKPDREGTQPTPKSGAADSAKLKQQLSKKDCQIQGFAAQLVGAGHKPEFKRVPSYERSRSSSPEGKKGGGKVSKKGRWPQGIA